MEPVLSIRGLRIYYHDRERVVKAVDGVDLDLARGETLALVGESGCGKTTVALAMLNLLPTAGRHVDGEVLLDGRDVLTLKGDELRAVRGRAISMIFQDPVGGLNPVMTIGAQVEEIVRTHLSVPKRESRRMAIDALGQQGLPRPERLMDVYPFQLSGGMCQRVMIAIATILKPRVIIADEPTSALDVTVQAQILLELNELKDTLGAAILLITHDLGVVAQMADHVAVMYAGRIVERTAVGPAFAAPAHPYTAALLAARPRLDGDRTPLQAIRGAPPDLSELNGDCAFLPRCAKAVNACRNQPWPPLSDLEQGHAVACYNPMYYANV